MPSELDEYSYPYLDPPLRNYEFFEFLRVSLIIRIFPMRMIRRLLRTGEADERNPVDDRLDRLIECLRKNPEIARELRIKVWVVR
jgi:hypothetical protein